MVGVGTQNQIATFWAQTSLDGFGKRAYTTPELISCRWQSGSSLKLKRGQEDIDCAATVFVAGDLAINTGDFMALGDLSAVSDPRSDQSAFMVFDVVDVPSIMGNDNQKRVMLIPK